MEHLKKILGSGNIYNSQEILGEYSQDQSFVNPIRPGCVVKPGNIENVQDLIKWARDTHTPLVPISSGPPHFRGDSVPSVEGAVIVDLSGMKKIIRIDEQNIQAIVEPGVTFGELIPELEKAGLAPFMPFVPRRTKSVVASLLEREPMKTPRYHWETSDPLGSVEVVYGNGELLRTGSASAPGTIEEQWKIGKAQIGTEGPGTIGFGKLLLAAQGTMGIVTWASMKCKKLPKIKSPFLIPSDDVKQLIELTYKLCWKRLDGECLILNKQNLASILDCDADGIRALLEKLPPWVLVFNLEGGGIMPEEKVEYQEADLIETAHAFGLEPKREVPGASAEKVAETLSRPSLDPYWKLRFKGGAQDIFFITTMDKTPSFIEKVKELAGNYGYPLADIGVYIQPIRQGASCHCEFNLSYDSENSTEAKTVEKFITEGARILADAGAFFSRPYGPWAEIVYERAPHTVALLRKTKNIFDPEGIMNPGKLCFEGVLK